MNPGLSALLDHFDPLEVVERRHGRFQPATPEPISWAWDVARRIDRGFAMLIRAEDGEPDPEAETTTFIASTDTPDRAMDVIKQDWNLKPWRQNPVVLDNHDPQIVAGKGVSAEVPKEGRDAGKLVIKVKWDLKSPDARVVNVGHQHIEGIRRAGSVGFRPGKRTRRNELPKNHPAFQEPIEVDTWWGGTEMVAGWYFERCELLEFSSATVPMNPEATQRSYLAELGIREPGAALSLHRGGSAPVTPDDLDELLYPVLMRLLRTRPELRHLLRALLETGPPKSTEPSFYEQVALLVREEM